MGTILIKNGRIWDGEGFFFADLLTKDDKIAKISPDIKDEAENRLRLCSCFNHSPIRGECAFAPSYGARY